MPSRLPGRDLAEVVPDHQKRFRDVVIVRPPGMDYDILDLLRCSKIIHPISRFVIGSRLITLHLAPTMDKISNGIRKDFDENYGNNVWDNTSSIGPHENSSSNFRHFASVESTLL